MLTAILGLAVLDFSLFGAAVRVVFAKTPRTPPVTRLMVAVGTLFSLLHVYRLATAPLAPRGAWIGALLYVAACVLFVWTARSVKGQAFRLAYCPGGPQSVVSSGPYRWMRHPFYLSYTLAWFAGVVAVHDARLLVTVAIMLAFYVAAAFGEERRLLRGPAADDYRAYRRRVGVLLPRW